jgi:hypothetical protein
MTDAPAKAAQALRLLTAGIIARAAREQFSRPAVVDEAASLIAEALRPSRPDVIVTWDLLDDALLAHDVARHLGIRTALVQEPQEGVLDLDPPIESGRRVVLLATSFDRRTPARAAASLIEQRGGVLVKVASLVGTADRPALADVEHIVFAD